ncbi:MAG: hypothetical protein EOP48_20175 [Sphingobacteriales bacterium]|nr:MAG: hypothetical protein EOP48_20175 [Sphingobacteriales bacterium]
MARLLLIVLIAISFTSNAQGVNEIDYLAEKIRKDYPGFLEKTSHIDFDKFVRETGRRYANDTFKAMAKIVDFFADRHLDILKSKGPVNSEECDRALKDAILYFKKSRRLKKLEGFWISEYAQCILAIRQTSEHSLNYSACVIESRDSSKLRPGQLFYNFEHEKDNRFFTLATNSRSSATFYIHSEFRNDSVMTAGPYNKWKKINYFPQCLKTYPQKSDITTGAWLDEQTYLITIPASSASNGAVLDSIIAVNPKITQSLEHLIVDIRSNSGGKTAAYASLMPLLYTNPILTVNGSIYCSEDYIIKNEKDRRDYILTGNIDSAYLSKWNDWISRMQDNVGKFITTPQDTLVLDSVLTYPKRVSILVNYGCQSAAEIFLLESLQSKKVTLFGEHTAGAIDFLNFYPQNTPSGQYKIYIATTMAFVCN